MNQRGVTIPEVLVAILILAIGLLGLGTSGLHVGGLVSQGARASLAATFGMRRLELLRAGACRANPPANGMEALTVGAAVLAVNTWSSSIPSDGQFAIRVVTRYAPSPRRARSDTLTTVVVCR